VTTPIAGIGGISLIAGKALALAFPVLVGGEKLIICGV